MSLTKTDLPVAKSLSNKPYGKIIITLDNCLLPEEVLSKTPSFSDGLDIESETSLRIWGCELIQTAGILLRLPQVAMATGQVLLQRFYFCKSLARCDVETTAMACVCLASKIEEAPRRIRDVINVFHHIKQVNDQKDIQPMVLDPNYITLKTQVIKAERRVLKELGFCVHVKHPHKIIVMYLQVLSYEKHQGMMQMAWNYMNDSLRTDVFVRFSPEVIACACIYLSARNLKLSLPKNPSWYVLFGVDEPEIKSVCTSILRLYNRPKPNLEELNKRIEEIRKAYQETRLKHRAEVEAKNSPKVEGSPNSVNGKANCGGAYNACGAFVSRSIAEIPVRKHEKNNRSRSRSRSVSTDRKNTTNSKHGRKKHSRSRERSKSRDRAKRNSRNENKSSSSPTRTKVRSRSRKRTPSINSKPNHRSRSKSPNMKKHKSNKTHDKKTRYRSRSRTPIKNSRNYDKYHHRSTDRSDKYVPNDKYNYYSEKQSSKYKSGS